jgi:dTDP-4-amino-4,6-dideoxygalactose transaminase
LPHLESWLEARRRNAETYNKLLADSGLVIPTAPEHSRHTYHLYVVQVPNREKVIAKLAEDGIETGLHYPIALPFLEAYADFGHQPSDFPVASSQMNKILSLPMYAELTDEMIERVCQSLKNAVAMSATN